MQIKYRNFTIFKESKKGKNGKNLPNLKMSAKLEDGTEIELGAGWFAKEGAYYGSFSLAEGISLVIDESKVKVKEQKQQRERTAEEIQKEDEKIEKQQEKKAKEEAEMNALYDEYGGAINPEDIPF